MKNLFVDQVELGSHLPVNLLALRDPLLELPAFEFVFGNLFVFEFVFVFVKSICICICILISNPGSKRSVVGSVH